MFVTQLPSSEIHRLPVFGIHLYQFQSVSDGESRRSRLKPLVLLLKNDAEPKFKGFQKTWLVKLVLKNYNFLIIKESYK